MNPEDAERVQKKAASINIDVANASKHAAQLTDSPLPQSHLRDVHRHLRTAFAETLRALKSVEKQVDALDEDYRDRTPRQIVDEHSDRLHDRYDEPVWFVAAQLLEANRMEWLYTKNDTNGAMDVRKQGLTETQMDRLDQLQAAWEAYDGEE